jgi:hypothetical protein
MAQLSPSLQYLFISYCFGIYWHIIKNIAKNYDPVYKRQNTHFLDYVLNDIVKNQSLWQGLTYESCLHLVQIILSQPNSNKFEFECLHDFS